MTYHNIGSIFFVACLLALSAAGIVFMQQHVDLVALIAPSVPMGLGIAADVFAITLLTAIVFPDIFKKYWLVWLLAVGGGHALLPMVGQLSVIYLGPFLQEWLGWPIVIVEIFKTLAVVIGCYLLWVFLSDVFDGITDSKVEMFTGLTIASWWACTADAAYSGAAKAAPALEYEWGLNEIIASNIIAGIVVMVVCIVAILGGMFLKKWLNKPIYQVGAFYLEFTILGSFLVFFALNRLVSLTGYVGIDSDDIPIVTLAIIASVAYVTYLFQKKWSEIMNAQAERLAGTQIVDTDGNAVVI